MTGDVVKTTRLEKLKMEERVRCVRSTESRNSDQDGRASRKTARCWDRWVTDQVQTEMGGRSFGGIATPERRTGGNHKRDAARTQVMSDAINGPAASSSSSSSSHPHPALALVEMAARDAQQG